MSYHVELREVAPQLLAVVRDTATSETLTAKILSSPLWTILRSRGIRSGGHNVVVYHPTGRPEFDIEVGADVPEPFADGDGIVLSSTPAGLAATTKHVGPYSRLGDAHCELQRWCKDKALRLSGTSWEVYGHWNEDQAKLETDIFLLVDPR